MMTMLFPVAPKSSRRNPALGRRRSVQFLSAPQFTVWFPAVLLLLAGLQPAFAAPAIISTIPVNGANNVSPSAPVVFTFSTAMDPVATVPFFLDEQAGETPYTIQAWNSNNTVLTCTASPQFANSHEISWSVTGQDAIGNPLTGTASGTFTNIAGVNGGSGTNLYTGFEIGEYSGYQQTSAAPPAHLTYEFYAQTLLASNRTATNITVTLPTAAITNLVEDGLSPEKFSVTAFKPVLANFTSNYPAGTYTFDINPATSGQMVSVALPSYAFPNAPQVSNYVAAQSVNPAQPFTVTWNTFSNGGSTDIVGLIVVDTNSQTVFQSPLPGQPGVLTGTATSETIPAGTLQTNSDYSAEVVFIHPTPIGTNFGSFVTTYAVVGTLTIFNLSTTTNTPAPLLTLRRSGTNVVLAWPVSATGFNLEAATNLSSPVWNTLPSPVVVGTNNVVTNGISGPRLFFRLVNP